MRTIGVAPGSLPVDKINELLCHNPVCGFVSSFGRSVELGSDPHIALPIRSIGFVKPPKQSGRDYRPVLCLSLKPT